MFAGGPKIIVTPLLTVAQYRVVGHKPWRTQSGDTSRGGHRVVGHKQWRTESGDTSSGGHRRGERDASTTGIEQYFCL